jgi:hypothetical protein
MNFMDLSRFWSRHPDSRISVQGLETVGGIGENFNRDRSRLRRAYCECPLALDVAGVLLN